MSPGARCSSRSTTRPARPNVRHAPSRTSARVTTAIGPWGSPVSKPSSGSTPRHVPWPPRLRSRTCHTSSRCCQRCPIALRREEVIERRVVCPTPRTAPCAADRCPDPCRRLVRCRAAARTPGRACDRAGTDRCRACPSRAECATWLPARGGTTRSGPWSVMLSCDGHVDADGVAGQCRGHRRRRLPPRIDPGGRSRDASPLRGRPARRRRSQSRLLEREGDARSPSGAAGLRR